MAEEKQKQATTAASTEAPQPKAKVLTDRTIENQAIVDQPIEEKTLEKQAINTQEAEEKPLKELSFDADDFETPEVETTIEIPSADKKQKPVKTPSNRFKVDRLQVSSNLDGVILASFTRRALALAIDLGVLLLILSAWWVAIIVFIVMKLINKKLQPTVRRISTSIGWQVRSLDHKLRNYEVEEELRARFRKHMKIYLNILIYLPVALTALILVGAFTGFFASENEGNLLGRFLDLLNSTLSPLSFLVGGVFVVLYFGLMNYYYQGKTVGKKICGIRVVKLNGKRISFRGSIERATGYTASAALFFYGFLQFFWDPNRQTTHDKITETIVIRG